MSAFGTPEEFRDYWRETYGPTIVAYRTVADDPERTAELDAALAALADRYGGATGVMSWEYLLLTARVV